METRKVIIGTGGMALLSMPSKYRKAHNVKKGDVFFVEEDDQGRLVYTRIEAPSVPDVDIFGDQDDD